jgi:hypothetical protein
MRLDFMAAERQFLDHLAPIWHALPPESRGKFLLGYGLAEHADLLGLPRDDVPDDLGAPILVASYGDQRRALKAGRTKIARIEHGAGQSYLGRDHPSYAGGRDCEAVGLFLCPNDYSASAWRRSYPKARVEVVGCPKLDTLPARVPGPGPVVAISFHWSSAYIPEITDASPYYKGVLLDLSDRYDTIGHAHPRHFGTTTRLWLRSRIRPVPDFADVCRMADIYVADNSSTIFEFASTGRPVVLLNVPTYRRDVEHGLRFWAAAGVGFQVDCPEDLLPTIERALADPPEQRAAREEALRYVYGHRTGAAQRAADVLADWAASAVPFKAPAVRRRAITTPHLTPAERVSLYRLGA